MGEGCDSTNWYSNVYMSPFRGFVIGDMRCRIELNTYRWIIHCLQLQFQRKMFRKSWHEFINTYYFPFFTDFHHISVTFPTTRPLYKDLNTIYASPHSGISFTEQVTFDGKICRISFWKKNMTTSALVKNIKLKNDT